VAISRARLRVTRRLPSVDLPARIERRAELTLQVVDVAVRKRVADLCSRESDEIRFAREHRLQRRSLAGPDGHGPVAAKTRFASPVANAETQHRDTLADGGRFDVRGRARKRCDLVDRLGENEERHVRASVQRREVWRKRRRELTNDLYRSARDARVVADEELGIRESSFAVTRREHEPRRDQRAGALEDDLRGDAVPPERLRTVEARRLVLIPKRWLAGHGPLGHTTSCIAVEPGAPLNPVARRVHCCERSSVITEDNSSAKAGRERRRR